MAQDLSDPSLENEIQDPTRIACPPNDKPKRNHPTRASTVHGRPYRGNTSPGHRTPVSFRLRTPGDVRQTTTTATSRQTQANTNEGHGQGKGKEDRGNRDRPALGPRMVGSSRRTWVPGIPKVQELRRQSRRSVVECRSERATPTTGILPALPQSGRTVSSVWDGRRQQLRPSQDVQRQRPAPHHTG